MMKLYQEFYVDLNDLLYKEFCDVEFLCDFLICGNIIECWYYFGNIYVKVMLVIL